MGNIIIDIQTILLIFSILIRYCYQFFIQSCIDTVGHTHFLLLSNSYCSYININIIIVVILALLILIIIEKIYDTKKT